MTCNYRFALPVPVILFFLSTGCGTRAGGRLAGKVTLDGIPLTAGEVVVVTEDGSRAERGQIVAGEFVVENASLGPVKLFLSVPALPLDPNAGPLLPLGRAAPPPMEFKDRPLRPGSPELSPDVKNGVTLAGKVPAIYRNAKTTPFNHTVETGDNHFDLIMKGDGGAGPAKPAGFPEPPM
jgi:hypothetical protein